MKEYKYEERTIGHLLEDKARTIGEKVYFLHGEMKITYREMNAKTNSVANSLLGLGINKGDKVCMIMSNSVEFLYTYFALAKIGAVLVPINIALKGNLLKYQI
jgi:crotonobetaine/carnitine-CoA ligase